MSNISNNPVSSVGIDLSGSRGPGTGTPSVSQPAAQYEGTWGSGHYTGDSLKDVAGIPHSGLISNYLNDQNQINAHMDAGDYDAMEKSANQLDHDIDAFYANGRDGSAQYEAAQRTAQTIGLEKTPTPVPAAAPASEPLPSRNADGDSSLGGHGGTNYATSSAQNLDPTQRSASAALAAFDLT